jgi:hypothetical protein
MSAAAGKHAETYTQLLAYGADSSISCKSGEYTGLTAPQIWQQQCGTDPPSWYIIIMRKNRLHIIKLLDI